MLENSILSTEIKKFALDFVKFIINKDYHSAFKMLSSDQKITSTHLILKDEYNFMTNNTTDIKISFQIENQLSNWPSMKPNDCGWVYISLFNDYFSEAISVIIAKENEKFVIREIEWGRP